MFSIKKAFYTNGVIRTGTLDGSFADDYTKRFCKQNHFNSLIFFIFFYFYNARNYFFSSFVCCSSFHIAKHYHHLLSTAHT